MKWKSFLKMAAYNLPFPLFFASLCFFLFFFTGQLPPAARGASPQPSGPLFHYLPNTNTLAWALPFNKTCCLSRLLPPPMCRLSTLTVSACFFVCGGREREFLPPGQLECYKKFTGRLHAPDHSTCIIHGASWCHSGPFLLFALVLPHNSSRDSFLQPGSFAWLEHVESRDQPPRLTHFELSRLFRLPLFQPYQPL